jgi:NhaP-type Na+/H+ or K+/H+ antiporter
MNTNTVIVLAVVLFAWSICSERLAERNLGGPLVFVAAGLLLANSSWGLVSVDVESSTVHLLAELTLGLLLFSDASTVSLGDARQDLSLTSRLLGIGLPLTIVAGAGLAALLYSNLPIALAGLIGAALAPTDAALSASVVADERLPIRVRRVLNVESGLNDGIATPVVTFCIASAATVLGVATAHHDEAGFRALGQLAVGVGVGAAVAFVGGRLITIAYRQGWMQHGSRRLATLALALLAFHVGSEAGGNPFVAAFVGGLIFGAVVSGGDREESLELVELGGSLLSLVLWFVFGAAFVIPAFEHLDARVVVYAVCSLTVVRMLPVALSLIGAGQDRATVAFIAWFGPRGLASVVFALLTLEDLGETDPRVRALVHAIAITIVLSVVAHGLTARPFTRRYLATIEAATPSTSPVQR